MDFDFQHIAVPFRMQPGLRRMPAGLHHLTPLQAGSALHTEKRAVLRAGQMPLALADFDPTPALRSLEQAARQTPGVALPPSPPDVRDLALAVQEDFAILDHQGRVPWMCVCVPSHWAPEDKLGLSLTAIHAPVADNAALQAATPALLALATGGQAWERFVWTITPSARYDQHPRRHARSPWPVDAAPREADAFARQCFLRVERQTFLPVRGPEGAPAHQAVFTIRVMLQALSEAVATPAQARRLHDALDSMSEAAAQYKNLTAARGPVLRWLSQRMA
ncbi:MAG: DUF3445 domain-containing protein [Rubrivivax sp.]|nr:DUF3445 domain-containing protein [Burkholderiaceae bacterium]MDP2004538.1 DUF3445 domain-containing protein [Rubrivivax sp.]